MPRFLEVSGLPLPKERRVHGEEWLRLHGPPQEAQGQAHARSHTQSQRPKVHGALQGQARPRRPETPHGPVHPHHRHGARQDQDRHGQHGLQHAAPRLAQRPRCARIAGKRTGKTENGRENSEIRQKAPQERPRSDRFGRYGYGNAGF